MPTKTEYSCPNEKCKKPLMAYVPLKNEVFKEKQYWDGMTICPHCKEGHFKRVYPGGKIEIITSEIETNSTTKDKKPMLKRARVSDLSDPKEVPGIKKYVKGPGSELHKQAISKITPKDRAATIKGFDEKLGDVEQGIYVSTGIGHVIGQPKNSSQSLTIVISDGKSPRRSIGCFSGTCIFDNTGLNKVGEYAINWACDVFTFIPSLSEITQTLSMCSFTYGPGLNHEFKKWNYVESMTGFSKTQAKQIASILNLQNLKTKIKTDGKKTTKTQKKSGSAKSPKAVKAGKKKARTDRKR